MAVDRPERRKELIAMMRNQDGSSKSIIGRKRETAPVYERADSTNPEEHNFPGMWKIKFFVGVALFLGFLFMDVTGSKFFKVNSDKIESVISNSVETEEVMNVIQEKVNGVLKK